MNDWVALWSYAAKRWPAVGVHRDAFVAFASSRLGALPPPDLTEQKLADLFLVCGCIARAPAALSAFQTLTEAHVAQAVANAGVPAERFDDVREAVGRMLLVGSEVEPPRIAAFTGRGDLCSWVRVVASHAALEVTTQAKRVVLLDEDTVKVAPENHEADEAALLDTNEVRQAFRDALGALSAPERELFKSTFLAGTSLDELAPRYGVAARTVSQWLRSAHERFLDTLRTSLVHKRAFGQRECDTVLSLVRSRLERSFHDGWDEPQTDTETQITALT